jgi:hypothetical protein
MRAGENNSPAVFFCKKTGIMASTFRITGRENLQINNADSKNSNAVQKPKFYKSMSGLSRLGTGFGLRFQHFKGKRED